MTSTKGQSQTNRLLATIDNVKLLKSKDNKLTLHVQNVLQCNVDVVTTISPPSGRACLFQFYNNVLLCSIICSCGY